MPKILCWTILVAVSIQLTHASIIDNGITTQDTDSGLLWLDVTETVNLSYDEVLAMTEEGEALAGWRHATVAEFETLLDHHGLDYLHRDDCSLGPRNYCGSNPDFETAPGLQELIWLLGDTLALGLDAIQSPSAVDPLGAGYTYGFIGGKVSTSHWPADGDFGVWIGALSDWQTVNRATGVPNNDSHDFAQSHFSVYTDGDPHNIDGKASHVIGHYLVQPVPLPGAVWLFGSAVIFLAWLRSKRFIIKRALAN
jgi:hypothetical protein